MPTYEYQCLNCGYQFDRFQKITEYPLKYCPRCEGEVRRIISGGTGIIFKGSGFYETDYRRKTPEQAECCGMTNPCDNPKRCCGK